MAWEGCAWRKQWIEAAGFTPARTTASFTMKLTARSREWTSGPPNGWEYGRERWRIAVENLKLHFWLQQGCVLVFRHSRPSRLEPELSCFLWNILRIDNPDSYLESYRD